ncbi:Ku protein [Virgibacillus pantothenticus]|uniref:non-homologous end joining protein Ku n=1 Tax=Virgibacillus pantothenticus TaxID=1473 RepID=UPI0009869026|nr:Ku protein [Virgibacillus pantothenticus]MBU8567407.1 Ku protein [Virgibacillus pantothenticus]MBU8598988.1 Ku protein [Virgibacillus pantothenticus]MBU8633746.1 Ku protein [Virgibacillus pantothenticus]MBU8641264.1 Ku protein [Virgibacillus pantothenticus]MBU8645342.1 Ku protein [Virgibacillus pantothenticus]
MHTMWKGTISFGLVNIPVKMHAATENKDIQLRQLHKECQSPIKYERTCPVCERPVKNEEIVKAYEYAKNKFVVLDEEELEALKQEQADKAVEIVDFVQLAEVDPIYYEKSYFLSPNEGGAKAYGLLRKALKETEKIGIAKMMIRSKEQLAIIRVYQDTLVVETIHYPDEVRSVADVPNVPKEVEANPQELDTAKMLIEQLTTAFDPTKYKDEYRHALLDLIEQKKEQDQTATALDKPSPDAATNLMDALQASLERAKQDKPKPKQPQLSKQKEKKVKKKKTGT